ncbi:stage II sporulation protein D [Bacillus sp. FJAT-50079]|uniref:stage II sporulation protein D n=1 Tax=Bacillus sp. FJAT-50079 TaxID=2833577 RepID=UPI001BC9396B|nr:stage II sporulation protein D [Bacillus sp. FJAT-50079]MBS4206784.1 stage II sporulation protein D [Bacillus sp. FJAT-50079]
MNQLKTIAIIFAVLIILTFTLPSLVVMPNSGEKTTGKLKEQKESIPQTVQLEDSGTEVAVFRTATNEVETLPLEEYVVGVVASEMPSSFEPEALKAQALTARTFIMNHLVNGDKTNIPEGADVTDTQNYQVYRSKEDALKEWGADYNWDKIVEAVKATEGEILTYNGKPIAAQFFSTSNGYTENAEDYWQNQIPYLKSVASPWDNQAPNFEVEKTISTKQFEEKLGVKLDADGDIGTVIARTPGKKVAEVKIGDKTFTGREIREKLELRSTDFSWVHKGDSIIITTKGFGHGVGMSQYGANGMAKEGKDYQEIVSHYYQDVAISNVTDFIDKKLASK